MDDIDARFGHLKFPFRVLNDATDCFHEKHIIGRGGFGTVYKASLPIFNRDRQLTGHPIRRLAVAIKRGNGKSGQGESEFKIARQSKYEFVMEIGLLSSIKHNNIIPLIGYCTEQNKMILVYEYVSNKSLDTYMEPERVNSSLTWAQSLKICIGVAYGLEYLHLGGRYHLKTVHRDIKSANILLRQNLQAVISDFGLCEFAEPNQQLDSVKHRRAGTPGYLDPHYIQKGCLSEKVDIYSFGVLLFEVLSGKLASSHFPVYHSFLSEFKKRSIQAKFENIIPDLKKKIRQISQFPDTEVNSNTSGELFNLADECLQENPEKRPIMKDIIVKLEKMLNFQITALDLRIPLEEIEKATKNFDYTNIIGWGESARVYKGELSPSYGSKMVAVKRFNSHLQNEVDFLVEILMLCDYKHENVIALHGFYYDANEKIMICEYASQGSLDYYLSNTSNEFSLTWTQRLNICLGAARGLDFIHTCGLHNGILHGDVKSANILLTHSLEAKISNFGLSKTAQKNLCEFLISSGAGTLGYSDPAYTKNGVIAKASDVYSFGVVLFEVLGSRLVIENDQYYGVQVEERKKQNKIVHENKNEQIDSHSFSRVSAIAHHCVQENPEERPTMGQVVQELTEALALIC